MWVVLEWAAWLASIALFGWMLLDFIKVNRSFDETVLLSSREGVDELFADTKGKGAQR